jgi:hypothetical protein
MHLGVEAGFNQPIIGLDYSLNSGVLFKVFAGKQDLNHNVYLDLAFTGSYYQGKNPGYSFSNYGIGLLIKKSNWRIAPFVESGVNYVVRELDKNKEWGLDFNYVFGFLINFHYENMIIYPACYYDGLTDFRKNAGSVGIKLGISYELQ